MSFVFGESCDGADDEVVWREAEVLAYRVAGLVGRGVEIWFEFDPASNGGVLIGRADAACEELRCHGVGNGDDEVAALCGGAFGDGVEVVEGAGFKAAQRGAFDGHEGRAVDGVDDADRCSARAHWLAEASMCGEAAEDSGFG